MKFEELRHVINWASDIRIYYNGSRFSGFLEDDYFRASIYHLDDKVVDFIACDRGREAFREDPDAVYIEIHLEDEVYEE